MRAALKRQIRESGLTQAQFAAQLLGEEPASLSMTLTGVRGLSRSQRAYLGVKREIVYREVQK